MEKSKIKEKPTILAGIIKRPSMDLNVECNEMHGEFMEIFRQNDQVEKESTRVIQECVNYETLTEE